MLDFLYDPSVWMAFATLTLLEIVLGIDNLILISILSDKLPVEQQKKARRIGLVAALVTRLMLISLAFVISKLEGELFSILGHGFSGRDLLLIAGGLFLMVKGTLEIHHKIEDAPDSPKTIKPPNQFTMVILQIAIMDIIFSFDSVMTAIGVADHLPIMIAAILISMVFMVLAVDGLSAFIARHPTVKVLALSYMLLIGMALVGDSMGFHIPKGYLYFSMAFSMFVEFVNMAVRRKATKKALASE
jgi:predicted tellurium resistance membrane protein TerC